MSNHSVGSELAEPDHQISDNGLAKQNGWTPQVVLWLVLLVLVTEVAAFTISAPFLVLPDILARFETDQVVWLDVSVTLAIAVLSPILGKFADIYGKKRVMLIILLAVVAGILISWIAPNYLVFLLGRSLQAASAALAFMAVTMVRQIFPAKARGIGIGVVATGAGLINAAVPIVTGMLVGATDYTAVFWAPMVWAIFVGVLFLVLMPESPIKAPGKVNVLEGLLLGVGLAVALAAVSMGQTWGWVSAQTICMIVGGIVLVVVWWLMSRRSATPLIEVKYLKNPRLLLTFAIGGVAGIFGTIYYSMLTFTATTSVELGFGYGLGLDPAGMGIFFSAYFLGTLGGGTLGGFLAGRKIGHVGTLLIGQLVFITCAVLSAASTSSYSGMFLGTILAGVGGGMTMASMYGYVVSLVKPEVQAVVSGMASLMLAVISAVVAVFFYAVINALFLTGVPEALYKSEGIQIAFLFLATVAILSTLASIALVRIGNKDRDAEPTAVPSVVG
ncbi:MFS transporter [Arthrobacter sp. MYb213]|uniref:MFS transporter n=1 Tax=Arthrobacter sp. MYb213 TaxID=1848595 RepID=UPI000CFA9FF3|nr:MFS transporter [Arthrobacter sp. MYb213]PRB66761.1 hypothetical protein CQ011_17060 [Arthrobacter sp. MYb213]